MSQDDRLTTMETALAHAELAIEDLSRVVQDQDRDIAFLRGELRRVQARLAQMEDGGDSDSPLCAS